MTSLALALGLAILAGPVVAVTGAVVTASPAAADTPKTVDHDSETTMVSAFPSFVVSAAGTKPALSTQTQNGASASVFGLVSGMSADQEQIARARLGGWPKDHPFELGTTQFTAVSMQP